MSLVNVSEVDGFVRFSWPQSCCLDDTYCEPMNCKDKEDGCRGVTGDRAGDEITGWDVMAALCWGGISSSPFDGTAVWQLNRTCIDIQTGDAHVFLRWSTELKLFSEAISFQSD